MPNDTDTDTDADESTHQGTDVWTDFRRGYVPGEELDVHPGLELHAAAETDLDPITYEVIRHRLFTINDEHGDTLTNVSGSPVAKFAKDFQPTILTEHGEVISHGPFVQLFSPAAQFIVNWTLENRSGNPGIAPGDAFLCNDPWIGSTHQPDVFLVAPVFHEGEVFCWAANAMHQADIGGVNPGSFCPDAESVFEEPEPIPPVKLVEGGTVKEDVRQLYLRNSRLPRIVGLDLSAQIAGITVARDRIEGVIDEYGAATVKGAMHRILTDAESKFQDKIEKIPGGTWRGRSYMEGMYSDDERVFTGEVQVRKEGDQLRITNENTDGNTGAMNITQPTFRTAAMMAINPLLAYDSQWATGGVLRRIDFETEPGRITSAEWPSGVSNGGSNAYTFAFGAVYDAVVRMLAASPALRSEIVSGAFAGYGPASHAGIDQWGEEFGAMNLDVMGPSTGATLTHDGVDTGGMYIASPKSPIPNIEENEMSMPMMYLFKREQKDYLGHGEYRSGAGMLYCMKPHKTDEVENAMSANGSVLPIQRGLAGYPGNPLVHRIVRDSDVEEAFEDRTIPQDSLDRAEMLPSKTSYTQRPDDLIVIGHASAPGYGDPIKRDPEKVVEDVRKDLVSEAAAEDIYGVVLDVDGDDVSFREDATERRRKEIRERRIEEADHQGGA